MNIVKTLAGKVGCWEVNSRAKHSVKRIYYLFLRRTKLESRPRGSFPQQPIEMKSLMLEERKSLPSYKL